MTADVELLPLPDGWNARILNEWGRANVAHATAAKDAEITAMRAEVRDAYAAADSKAGWEWKKRAERLAEALRGVLPYIQHTGGCMGNLDPALPVCGCGMLAFREQLSALLRDQEEGK